MTSPSSRRSFLKTTAAAAAATTLTLPRAYAAAGDDTLRVGLVGCGGRGSGAAVNALEADPKVKLVAMCDVFMDRLEESLNNLRKNEAISAKIDVAPDRCFDGFDGYNKLLNSGVDVVLLCTPPGFRPQHMRAAIDAGKHVFCEKPLAVDAAGAQSVVEIARKAREKNLSLCSGFCYRYDAAKRETVQRIHQGEIGDVMAIHATYLTSPLWHRGNNPKWTEMEYQMRNWYYFPWLSGDFIVEQMCHNMDKAAWVFKGEMPVSATGLGGRQQRTDPKYGTIYDHFSVAFEYANGARLFTFCRQMQGCVGDVNDHILGTKGQSELMKHTVHPYGGKEWAYGIEPKNMYQVEHDELFAAIRAGKPINDGESAANSTLMGILGREACYTGKKITWKALLASKQNLSPKQYAWGPNPVPPIAVPGITRFS